MTDYDTGYDRGRAHRTQGDDPACGSDPTDSAYAAGYWDGYGLKPKEGTMDRFEKAAALREQAAALLGEVHDAIAALQPLGRPTELSEALGLHPPVGQKAIGTAIGTFIFKDAKDRFPTANQIAEWDVKVRASHDATVEAIRLTTTAITAPGTVTGNQEVWLAGLQALRAEGLLNEEEQIAVAKVETFFAAHPDERYAVADADGNLLTSDEYSKQAEANLAKYQATIADRLANAKHLTIEQVAALEGQAVRVLYAEDGEEVATGVIEGVMDDCEPEYEGFVLSGTEGVIFLQDVVFEVMA